MKTPSDDSIAGRLSMKYRNKPPSEEELKELYGQLDSVERQFQQVSTDAALDAKRLIDDKMKLQTELAEAKAALGELTDTAIVLSADYLSAFHAVPDDGTIQGWHKAQWVRLLAAHNKARALLRDEN